MLGNILPALNALPKNVYLYSFSSLDKYFRIADIHVLYVAVESDLVDLARTFTAVQFPGLEDTDALVTMEGITVKFKCYETIDPLVRNPFTVLSFLFDIKKDRYLDTQSAYRNLRGTDLSLSLPVGGEIDSWKVPADAAILVSRYHFRLPSRSLKPTRPVPPLSPPEQQDMLMAILTGKHPERGLSLLMRDGFIPAHWPELAAMNDISHNKEFHPEGNAWEHTLETFNYRKTTDPVLSFGLLLHDIGKPAAEENEGRRFDGHAQIGSKLAYRFLKRLGLDEEFTQNVTYLIREHMMPAAVSKLPVYRTEKMMSSPLFPVLLELYRCDESSTFRGPGNYYKACEKYRMFLKHNKNPYRGPDGKKLSRSDMERVVT